jgi:hypothetical protein
MKLEVNLVHPQAIKVLGVDPKDGSLRSCHGGNFQWDPPILKGVGSWKPGKWTFPVRPSLCCSGYHLTDDPSQWWDKQNSHAYFVEYRGRVDGLFTDSGDRKIAVESCRLLRPLTAKELEKYNIFTEGEHTIDGKLLPRYFDGRKTQVYVGGIARVEVQGDLTVNAYGNAEVTARDQDESILVSAFGNAVVNAFGNTMVYAQGYARVNAHDDTLVSAEGNSCIIAYDNATVQAYEGSHVTSFGAKVKSMPNFQGTITRM